MSEAREKTEVIPGRLKAMLRYDIEKYMSEQFVPKAEGDICVKQLADDILGLIENDTMEYLYSTAAKTAHRMVTGTIKKIKDK